MNSGMKKSIVTLVAVAVVALAIVIVGPVVYRVITSEGVRTGGVDTANIAPATTDRNGTWEVARSGAGSSTSVGYTFNELLPGSNRTTSGSTREVTGTFEIADDTLRSGRIVVDMATLTSDDMKRDNNVRDTIFTADQYPEAAFEVAGDTDLSMVPDDGSPVDVEVPGRLTIRGVTNDVTVPLKVMRNGEHVLMSGTLVFNRLDYNVRTPDFVAASVDENGELNLRIVLRKAEAE
ncbi:YceI family protein [Corynebacterium sp. NPDC060344]|uniref:YceI family protein n=1 Tax=Corynebacterium sp. NPDC060344 TaxID=3347101 RepID=UPI0036574BFF